MEQDFVNLNVVVTGGTGALGSAVAGELISRGANCFIPCFSDEELKRFPYTEDDRVRITSAVDLTNESATSKFFDAIPSLFASIHIAGGFAMAPVTETTLDEFNAMMAMNASSCFLSCREAVKRIRSSEGAGGRIVNVAARPALEPAGGMVAYSASKAAVASITLSLAEELKQENIFVSAVAPSIIDTEANRAAMPTADHASWPTPAEIARTICFLASPANQTTHSLIVPVYGKA